MGKLVAKTVVIVLSVIIVIGSIIFGAFALYKPKVIGDLSQKVGNYGICCWAYSKQYSIDKSESSFDEANFAYQKYAFSLIEDGEYEKATDKVLNANIDGKTLSNSTFNVVRIRLELVINEQNKQVVSNCIKKIEDIKK